jgi:hypothetical protein
MTPGFRSTEFWHAAASSVAGIALCSVGLARLDDTLAYAGAALLALSTLAYSHSRGKAKTPRPYLPPVSKL